jgi:hypothetical protein
MQVLIVQHLPSRAVVEVRKSTENMQAVLERNTSCTDEGGREETITKKRKQ